MNFRSTISNLGFWSKLLEGLAFVTLFSTFGISVLAIIIKSGGYDPDYGLLGRLVVFLVAIGYGMLQILPLPNRISGIERYQDWLTILISAFLLLSSILLFILWTRNGAGITELAVPVIIFSIIYVLRYLFASSVLEKLSLISRYGVAALVFMALIMPAISSRYINSESYFDPIVVSNFKNNQREKFEGQTDSFVLELSGSDLDMLRLNREKLKLEEALSSYLGYYELTSSEARNEMRIFLQRADVSALCLLGDFSNKKISALKQCILDSNYSAIDSKKELIDVVSSIPLANTSLKNKIIYEINSAYLDNKFIESKDIFRKFEDVALAKTMFIKGAYFHHYNSIAHTINSSHHIFDYLSNQYGLGPLLVVKGISEWLGTNTFDSIYLSIFIVDFFVFLVLLLFLKDMRKESVVWLGFSMSILVTYFLSNTLAPFLYFTRLIPVVLLAIILARATWQGVEMKSNPLYLLGMLTAMAMVAVYNFEYAILTFSAVITAGLIARSLFYSAIGSVFLVAVLGFKTIFSTSQLEGNGPNYLAYIAGAGFNSTLVPLTYVFLVSLVAILGAVVLVSKKIKINPELIILSILPVFLVVKVLWNGKANHIGPLFLIVALLLVAIKKVCEKNNFQEITIKTLRVYYISSVIMLIGSAIYWPIFYLNQKFDTVEYVGSPISQYFKVSKGLVNKIDSFKSIYHEHDVVLSAIDNALALSVGHEITRPYPDISTNINFPVDTLNVIKAFTRQDIHRVIVDKDVVTTKANEPNYHDIGISLPLMTGAYRGFAENLGKMEFVYQKLLKSGFSQCNENNDFVVLCRVN